MEWWAWLLLGGGLVGALVLANTLGWIDLSGRTQRGSWSGSLSIGDEVFAPHRHEAQVERDAQSRTSAPSPRSPDTHRGIALASDNTPDRVRKLTEARAEREVHAQRFQGRITLHIESDF